MNTHCINSPYIYIPTGAIYPYNIIFRISTSLLVFSFYQLPYISLSSIIFIYVSRYWYYTYTIISIAKRGNHLYLDFSFRVSVIVIAVVGNAAYSFLALANWHPYFCRHFNIVAYHNGTYTGWCVSVGEVISLVRCPLLRPGMFFSLFLFFFSLFVAAVMYISIAHYIFIAIHGITYHLLVI